MIRSTVRALALGASAAAVMLVAQSASATSYTFTLTSGGDSTVASKVFSSTVNNSTLDVRATAWHATPLNGYTGYDTIASAQLGLYTPGLGVLSSGESSDGNYHQIDNVGGVDFVMLQFSQDVTIGSISRKVFPLAGVSPSDSDASYWADTGHQLGAASGWNGNVDLTRYYVNESTWTELPGGSSDNIATLGTAAAAATWLVGADFFGTLNDGFKIASLTANTAAVPEPASWATMLAGFGAIGGTMRRRKVRSMVTAA